MWEGSGLSVSYAEVSTVPVKGPPVSSRKDPVGTSSRVGVDPGSPRAGPGVDRTTGDPRDSHPGPDSLPLPWESLVPNSEVPLLPWVVQRR